MKRQESWRDGLHATLLRVQIADPMLEGLEAIKLKVYHPNLMAS